MWNSKDVYYISGSTGILAEEMGKALLSQFQETRFREEKIPFIRNLEQAENALQKIISNSGGMYPLVFCTILDEEIRDIFNVAEVEFFDFLLGPLERLEEALETRALREPGHARHFTMSKMTRRVDAIHFSLEHDDGTKTAEYDQADIVLVGVSRSGKTPVSVYLATHMELKAANFPLTPDHLCAYQLPDDIIRNGKRVIGLTSSPQYLHKIRDKRYPGSNYASLANCTKELKQARHLFLQHNIRVLNVEGKSIEELAVQAVQALGFSRKRSRRSRQRRSR